MRSLWVDDWLGLLLPRDCLLCGDALPWRESGALCMSCSADLPACPGSAPAVPGFSRVRATFAYEFPVDQLVLAAKFGRQIAVAADLGRVLASRVPAEFPPPDLVVPVPLHWRRQATRGFNQAEELARVVCRQFGWRLARGVCHRVRETPEQSRLTAAERLRNLDGAFVAKGIAPGARVLVIDDVLTTGATAAAVGRALLDAGAGELQFLALARVL